MNIQELKRKLKLANDAYRKGSPIMYDEEYDSLENDLREKSCDDEWFKKGVNDETPKDRAFKMPFSMMSLDKVKTIEALKSWAAKFPDSTLIITPKYDGLSVGLSREGAWTRGDGVIGQDCTRHVKDISMRPDVDDNTIIRGEIIIDNRAWNTFKENNPTAKSQRNSATGLINGDYDAKRKDDYNCLRIMPYEIMGSELNKDKQLLKYFNMEFVKVKDVNKITEKFLFELFNKWRKKFPIDGLVIDINESVYRKGNEANGNPSYSIAYKHPSFSERKDGIIDHIERNVNRDGIITPVVVLKEPINISGADILKVSAINMRYVQDWGLYPNTKVTIVRSGEVIPKIVTVENVDIPFKENFLKYSTYDLAYLSAIQLRQMQLFKAIKDKLTGCTDINRDTRYDYMFETCPICGSSLSKVMTDEGEWCDVICKNVNCEGRLFSRISKFFKICGIDGFGEKTFNSLVSGGLIERTPFEVFSLTYDNLIELDGWGEVSVNKFIFEIDKLRTELPFVKFLHATGWFSDLGEKTLQKILANDGWNKTEDELIKIEGVQKITANKFRDGVAAYLENEELINSIFTFKKEDEVMERKGKLNGMVVCMTGFRDKDLVNNIIELGGVVGDGVTKATTCLIVKDATSNSSKIQKAMKNGIEILEIDTFREKYL